MPNNLPMPVLPAELLARDGEGRTTVWAWLAENEPGALAIMADPLKSPLEFDADACAIASRDGKRWGGATLAPETVEALGTRVVGMYDPVTLERAFP